MNFWEGKKIRLRSIEPEDYDFFYRWNLETETQMQLDRIWFPSSIERQKKWAEKKSVEHRADDQHFLVIETLDEKPIGSINANQTNRIHGSFKYGIAVHASARRKGYASDALNIFLNYYFNELRYNKVNATVYEFNVASIKLHEKLQFTREGRLRQTIYSNGQFWDELIFGMTKDEFNLL